MIATLAKEIVGPFFFEESIADQESYLDMLKTFFYPFLEKKDHEEKNFLQDDAPVHFCKTVRS